MKLQEKELLVDVTLRDVKCNWAFEVENRLMAAIELSEEIYKETKDKHWKTLIAEIKDGLGEYKSDPKRFDGRFFRDEFPFGYEDMEDVHGLAYTYNDKSEEFKGYVAFTITYPKMHFADLL